MRYFSKTKFQNLKWSLMELELLHQICSDVPDHEKTELKAKMQQLETVFNEMEAIITQLDLRGKYYNELVNETKYKLLGKSLKEFKNRVSVDSKAHKHLINSANFLKKA